MTILEKNKNKEIIFSKYIQHKSGDWLMYWFIKVILCKYKIILLMYLKI